MKCKFKVGDKVIGNHPTRYVVTHKGWIGEVTGVYDNGNFSARGDEGIDFKGLDPEFFDLYKARKEAKVEYKVGDRVIIEESNIEFMSKYAGKHGSVKAIWADKEYPYEIAVDNGATIWCKVKCLEPVNEKIVITVDGRTTLARLYKDGKVVKSAEARCCPEDTFDFKVGANLAYERLMDVHVVEEVPVPVEPPKPKYYNGKVVCTDYHYMRDGEFTIGKIYTFTDGIVTTDKGTIRPRNVHPVEDINETKNLIGVSFIPLVEE